MTKLEVFRRVRRQLIRGGLPVEESKEAVRNLQGLFTSSEVRWTLKYANDPIELLTAFSWGATPQGHEYWYRLHTMTAGKK